MIKPNQSKKQRFLLAATTESSNSVSHATTHEVPKQVRGGDGGPYWMKMTYKGYTNVQSAAY